MLFVLKFTFDPDHTHRVLEMWKHFRFPSEVKVINRYILIGKHVSLAIFDAPDAESILKITAPFSGLGIAHVTPAMPLEEAIRVSW
ncbi:MAG: GYD domain-containing protein [Methanomicrobiales archaeon]|nr:GYD domain-containing protein [Methanomicrobiales archaeon]